MNALKMGLYLFTIVMIGCAVMDLVVWHLGNYYVPSYVLSIFFVSFSVLAMIIIKEVNLEIE